MLFVAVIAFSSCKKAPEANFTATPTTVQPGEPVIFTDGVNDRKNATITYDYGDGTSSDVNERNPSHIYMMPGIYTVSQNVMGNKNANTGKGKYATITTTITVIGAAASFTSSNTSSKMDETVNFTDKTTNGDKGFTIAYKWWMVNSRGDNISLGETKNAKYTFTANDKWYVYLQIWQGEYTSTATDTITVGSGVSNEWTTDKLVASWDILSDTIKITITNSTDNTTTPIPSCAINTSIAGAPLLSVQPVTDYKSITIDANGDIWVIRYSVGDQVQGSVNGNIKVVNNTVAVITGGAWAGTYSILSLTNNSMVLESTVIDPNKSCQYFNGTSTINVSYTETPVRTIRFSR